MAGREPEESVPLPVVRQGWRDLTFLHWRYPPEVIAGLLPDGLRPDVADGSAWLGLTPFSVVGFRVLPLPPVPRLSDFPETNLRTYVVGPDGLDGLWFLTLHVDSTATALVARTAYGVPYVSSSMTVDRGVTITYTSRRRDDPSTGHRIVVRPGAPIPEGERTSLDDWLTGRWRAWTRIAGRPATVPVRHEPWPLHRASVEVLEESLTARAGLPAPDGPPLVHWSPGVEANLGPPRFRR